MMPKVTYFTSNGINNSTECLVETRYGKNNEENMRCINKIINHINDLKSSLIKIIYIAHGWTMGDPDDFIDMKDALLKRYGKAEKVVVGIIHWKNAAARHSTNSSMQRSKINVTLEKIIMCCKQDILGGVGFSTTYGQASVNTWTVGNVIGYLHENIIRRQNSSNTETYCIGHSLGSHVCGFFGKMVNELLGQKYRLQKIVGLDPAGPIFDDPLHNPNLRLNKEDAKSVETILTNTETLGFSTPLGDVDLHIHGGACQPCCKNCDTTSPGGIGLSRWITASCHHVYAYQLMLDLINRQIPCSLEEKDSLVLTRNN